MKILKIVFIGILSSIMMIFCQGKKGIEGPEVVSLKARPFQITDVTLLEGPFKDATELNKKYILNYEPDRLLSSFRLEAGLEPKAEAYGGWESPTLSSDGIGGQSLAGHTLGHYMSACALMYNTSGEKEFLDRVNYIVDELETCQNADGQGYIGAVKNSKKIFKEQIAKGEIDAQPFALNGLWAPFYIHHKIMAGLRDAYHLCGNEKALVVEKRFADWIDSIVSDLNEEQVQKMLLTEYGGLNETLFDLYSDLGNEKYLRLAELFYDNKVLDPLSEGIDDLDKKHGNTQIPKLIGLARKYELTGSEQARGQASFFWNRVVKHHSYVTGGHGNHEYLGPPDMLSNRLSYETTETCNVHNMLKLSRHLFKWNASAEVADFYERALFNQILSSQHPIDGRVIYNLSLEMGHFKMFEDPNGFTCCIGTGMENHSKYAANIYFHNSDVLYVSQFIASELNWKEKGVTVKQSTLYPEEQGTRFEIETEKSTEFTLKIRHPYWLSAGELKVFVNGKKVSVKQDPESFYDISRTWNTGDIVKVEMPFSLRLESMPDNSNRVAVMFGPIVLAADLGEIENPNANDASFVPVIISETRNPEKWLVPVSGNVNTFKSVGVGRPRDVVFRPFYGIYDRRYSVYLDLFDQEKWKEHQADLKAEQEEKKKLENMTYDFLQPGDEQSEDNHDFKGLRTYIKDFKNRKAIVAGRGGWLSFDLKTIKGEPMSLVVEYWGGFTGSKTFDILVNDKKIATEDIAGKRDGKFIDVHYEIPGELTKDNGKLNFTFKPHPGSRGGPIFKARTIKK